jgi:HK97 family phage major capsid protein
MRKPGIADLIVSHVKGNQRDLASAMKAMSVHSGPGGGYMLDRITADEIIEPLYATEVVMAAGARVERFEGAESMTYRKLNAGAAAYWAGEGKTVDGGEPKWGIVHLHPKELVAKTLVPNKSLRNASDRLEQQIQDDIAKAIRLAMDYSFLFGIGALPGESGHSGEQPLGLLHTPGVFIKTLGSDNGAKPKISDLSAMVGRIEEENVELGETAAWLFNPRDKRSFTSMTDTTGRPLLRLDGWESKEQRDLLGYPWFTTTQIPKNLTVGSSNDCSNIFFGEWGEFVVGISYDLEIVVDTSRYVEERQTLIQAVTYVDCGVFYPQAFQALAGVRGA